MVDVNQQNKKNRGSTFSSAVRTFAIYRKKVEYLLRKKNVGAYLIEFIKF